MNKGNLKKDDCNMKFQLNYIFMPPPPPTIMTQIEKI